MEYLYETVSYIYKNYVKFPRIYGITMTEVSYKSV